MINIKSLMIGIIVFIFAHIITWFQLNGQFFSEWFKNNNFILALFGIPISYLFIYGTRFTTAYFDGTMWPVRFVGFGVGILIYAMFVGIFFKEGVTLKTLVSLSISLVLICIQVFWK